jgi:hypothetical protein
MRRDLERFIVIASLAWLIFLAFGTTEKTWSQNQKNAANGASQPVPRSWTPQAKELPATLVDGDAKSFALLGRPGFDSPIDFGLEWPAPTRLNRAIIKFASLDGIAYQPALERQELQYWDGKGWLPLRSELTVDYSSEAVFAQYQRSGYVTWTYKFPSVTASRIRVLVQGSDQGRQWDSWCAARDFRALFDASEPFAPSELSTPRIVHIVGRHTQPESTADEASINLASLRFGAQVSASGPVSITWPRPRMVNKVVVYSSAVDESEARTPAEALEWWDGEAWHPVTGFSVERNDNVLVYKFTPLAVSGLRISAGRAHKVEAYLDSDASVYFRQVYDSHEDALMDRLLRAGEEPSFERVASLLLPLDFHKTAMGRVDNDVETMVLWNGTLLMVENQGNQKATKIDRWFAMACGQDGELFGSRPAALNKKYIAGYLPGVVTTYEKQGVQFTEQAFVTAPDDLAYVTAVEVEVKNESLHPVDTQFSIVLGRRMSSGDAEYGEHPTPPNPLNFDPLKTGYQLESATRVVRNAEGDIVLYADKPGTWHGTPWENTLAIPVKLGAKEAFKLHFFIPHVTVREQDARKLAELDFDRSLAKFEAYWASELSQGRMRLRLPEARLNSIYKNLLAQTLVTLRHDDELKYGAYWYEMYFGVEEGWPLVALAQYGFDADARRDAAIMLNATNMDKANYHHQYRNGLDPWYALEVFHLGGDTAWLKSITPRLVESAEWTIKTRQSETSSDLTRGLLPKHAYGGDIHTPAYSIYSNATCWRGLLETGLAMRESGQADLAKKYLSEAADYRARINAVCDQILDRSVSPPFLPMAIEIGTPGKPDYKTREIAYPFLVADPLGNYWNLFSPMYLETGIFPSTGERAGWIIDYLEKRGGLISGLSRFYDGLDHIYGLGYALTLLERQEREKYLATFYAVLAHGMARDTFTSPEAAGIFPLRVSNLALEAVYQDNLWRWASYGIYSNGITDWGNSFGSEPLSAGAGVALKLLRNMLIYEERDEERQPTGRLALSNLIPRRWLEDGQQLQVDDAPSYFGPLSFSIQSHAKQGRIEADVVPPHRTAPNEIVLRLPHPRGMSIQRVEVNGQAWARFGKEEVLLPGSGNRFHVIAFY